MWNFQRIICIWICCVSCMFGTTQLSTALVQAVPYEYFDDHDQSFYDLDTEQIQAKYDTRLLSQQMLPSSENLKGFHNSAPFHTTNTLQNDDGSHRNTLEMRKQNDAAFTYGSTAKLKTNDGPSDGNVRNNDWLEQMEETATKAASSTSAFTESVDELHLPRAASCFTNGQKYTHGQKVPRLDNCEVCLCMDGEIFCWWEKCDKKPAKTLTTYDDYSTPFEESSTIRMQLSPKTTFKSTLKAMKKSKPATTTTNEDYKYDDDDSTEIREMQKEYEGLKEQLAREEHAQERERVQEQEHEEVRMHEQHKNHNNKQMMKKKIYQQQEEEKYNNKKIKEEQQKQKQKQEMDAHRTQQQQKLKSNEHYEHQHHARNHNGNNRHHDSGSSGANSKILNFPENLPSVLYYDYKTEEHHQHQHQHREQHLKHQKQKQQQQHEKELKQRQQQKLLQKQQLQQQQKHEKLQPIQRHHNNRHHEYGQVFHTYNLSDKSEELAELDNGGGVGGPSTTFKYFSNGNENIYNGGDLLSDSDILPEPPTKKPKILTTTADTTDMAKTTGTPLSQIYRVFTAATAVTTLLPDKTSNSPTTTIKASKPFEKEILSSWDSNKPNNDKTNGNNNSNGNSNDNSDSKANRNNDSNEDLMDTDDQDDAFHRWLTAPDTNNKNYFTFNESTSMSGGVGGFDSTNSDYNGDERNYENIGFDSETGFSSASAAAAAGDTKATVNVMATGATKNIETAAASIYSNDAKANGMHENEQHFSVNNVHNGNGNGNGNYINMASSNGIINGNGNNNNIVAPFSQTYENFNRNNNLFGSSTTTTSGGGGNSNESGGGGVGVGIIGSTVSNEDNGVASVVNIDIMLTASSAELQQQQQPQSNTNIQTTNQQQQQQEKEQHFEHEKQIGITPPNEFMQPPSNLISNKNDVSVVGVGAGAVVKNNTLSSKIYDNSSSNSNSNNILGGNQNIEKQNWGVNLSNNNSNGNTNTNTNNNNNSATSYSSSSSTSDSFKFKHLPTVLVSQPNATSSTATAFVASAIPPTLSSTTSSPERQCNVMGTLYKIGDVLPQDTGNCLQCICIDGSTSDDTPRVTCSPHNCPPLVLPDLFDATGY